MGCIQFMLNMISEKKQISLKVAKIKSNTQYLSNVLYWREAETVLEFGQKNLPVCSIGVSKLVVQMAYLLYTCSTFKVNLFLSSKPFFRKKKGEQSMSPYLKFMLEEEYEVSSPSLEPHLIWEERKWHLFDEEIMDHIDRLVKDLFDSMAQKPQQQEESKIGLKKLIEDMIKKFRPIRLSKVDVPVIKLLETSQTFVCHSDLLSAFNNSLFYQLKKKPDMLRIISGRKKCLKDKMHYISKGINTSYAFKMIDECLQDLINSGVIFMERSSTKDYKDVNGYSVGYVDTVEENGKVIQKFVAKFYNLESINEQFLKQAGIARLQTGRERNNFIVEYSTQKREVVMRYVTPIQATLESIDIISIHSSNIMAGDNCITLETIDSVRNFAQGQTAKKIVVIKCFYRLSPEQEPLTKILFLTEQICIYGRIYMGILIRRPNKNQSFMIKECRHRLDHLTQVMLTKAHNFYDKL